MDDGAPRLAALCAGVLGILGAACAQPRTALVVAIASDLSIPSEIASVHARVGGAACSAPSCESTFTLTQPGDLPLSFGIEPGASASAPVELVIEARDESGASVVSRSVSTGFVLGETRVLVVHLDRACLGHGACGAGETCIAGSCASASVDPTTLAPAVRGHELDALRDAGPPEDAGPVDAGMPDTGEDADLPDANLPDAGVVPTSCRGLLASAPSGVARIDPDGSGGLSPFDAWCENEQDGGGWTLIAKVTGSSTELGYDGARWTGDATMAFGSVDTGASDALLAPYWAVPVTQLRVGNGTSWIVANVTGGATTLRDAMDVAGGVPLSASAADWTTLTSISTGSSACARSAIDATLDTSATSLHVRIGVVGGTTADCSDATFWIGAGASMTTSDSSCAASTATAGAARVCGPPGQRHTAPATMFVYGR